MHIDLFRSFSTSRDGAEDTEDWLRFFRKDKGDYSWSDLHTHPVTVVLGEAGIGKTSEFQNEVDRLQREGKPAFFISLNQLLNNESWGFAVGESASDYERWGKSSDTGYFFLDAVDEARLVSHAAFEQALSVVRAGLLSHMSRVRITISSRITDWTVDGVREAVRKKLVAPIEDAMRLKESALVAGTTEVGAVPQESTADRLEAFTVSLDPLSKSEAVRLADAFDVVDSAGFWAAVDDGDYEFMATRPLDLEWMVKLWNEKHGLGTYSQLIEGNISNRLTEVNPSYQAVGAALSIDQLRGGAEQLAAAAEFSGRPFVSTTATAGENEVAPLVVLSDWKPIEVSRLLSSAVFDEATFGRVKFHHRSIREYLTASWVNRQLLQGLPLHRALPLFSTAPFGLPVLIPSRRATLCWLAALNVKAREWVTRQFPEMFLFEGDPEAWDSIAVARAFAAYIERVKNGLRTDWYNSASEFRRVARRLPAGHVATLLAEQSGGSTPTANLLTLVKHGRLLDCANAVFAIYRNPKLSTREHMYALVTMSTVASAEHRAFVKNDLLAGRLRSNDLIASALGVIDLATLSVEELVKVFQTAGSESEYGSGPMSQVIKNELLPRSDAAAAQLLLSAIVISFPSPKKGKRFTRFPESAEPERAWLLDVLPDCLERLLTLLPKTLESFPEICLDAAERVEAIRDSGFADRDELSRLHALVANRPALRWQLALEIAQSEDIRHAASRLTWGESCLVSFGIADLPALITRANDEALPKEVRDMWFGIGMNLAIRELQGRQRTAALHSLASGPDKNPRMAEISTVIVQRIAGIKQLREYKREDCQRKRARRTTHNSNREDLTKNIEHIRDGSYTNNLHWLISYSFDHSGRESLTRVDFDVIAKDFGQPVSQALASGLAVAWSKAGTPNPADYSNGQVPWEAITASAGLHTLLTQGTDIASLNDADAARAARLAVWELNAPPSWFERLCTTHERAVCTSLHPWIETEAVTASNDQRVRRALELALRCSTAIRVKLMQPLVQLIKDSLVANPETLKSVLNALREDGAIESNLIARICQSRVTASLNAEGLVSEMGWVRTWLEEDLATAWAWFEGHVAGLGALAGKQIEELASAIVDGKWLNPPVSETNIEVLLRMHGLLTAHMPPPDMPAPRGESGIFWHPIARLRETIPRILVQTRGPSANRALIGLATGETDVHVKTWLNARVLEHAALEAQHSAQIEPAVLKVIGSPFQSEPRSERQLYEQVLARLEEIRKGVEEGPFSDRDLFFKNIPEKHLQLWLAARFLDSQSRRFSVHREEVVDADKRTDIQLSCQYGNVCVEIKPVDAERSYSANTLTDTLRTQIVGQYLKGYSSAHGILVLFRLDEKKWDIPNGSKNQDFSELVRYLKSQAEIIKDEFPSVRELQVFAINCIVN